MIKITCANCGKSYAAQPDSAGKRVKCRACGEAIAVPPAGGAAADLSAGSNAPAHAPALEMAGTVRSATPSGPTSRPESTIFDDDIFRVLEEFDAARSQAPPTAHHVQPAALPAASPFAPVAPFAPAAPFAAAAPTGAAGPTVLPPLPTVVPGIRSVKRKKKKKKGTARYPQAIKIGAIVAAGLLAAYILVLPIAFFIPVIGALVAVPLLGIGLLLVVGGRLWGIYVAFNQDVLTGLLFMFLPFYDLYYLIENWDEMQYVLYATLGGVALFGAAALMTVVAGI